MKRLKYIVLSLCCLTVMICSCIEEFNAQLPEGDSNLLVVDGNIISDSTCVFTLTRSFSLNEEGIPEDYNQINADVCVKGSDGSVYTGTSMGNGKYSVKIGTLNPQQTYHVEIVWEGSTYTSIPQQPLATEGLSLKFTQPDSDGPVHILLSTESPANNEAAYYTWNYIEDWEVRTNFRTNAEFNPKDSSIIEYDYFPYAKGWVHRQSKDILINTTANYNNNQLKDKTLYSIGNQDLRISHLYSTFVVQRKMTKGEYEYYECKKRFTNDMGGLFTPQPSELPTNLRCNDNRKRVIGYVGVNMNVSIRQLYIPTTEVNYVQAFRCEETEEKELLGKLSQLGIKNTTDLYNYGYRVSYYLYLGPMSPPMITWAEYRCVDCRALGADPNARPDFWPDF